MAHEKLLSTARERFQQAAEADRDNAKHALDDLRFLTNTGDGQWPESIRRDRESAGKPCITINRLPQYVRQVTGDIRRTNPAIKVVPGDGDANEDVAEIKGGLIRQIEAASSAQSIYEGAAESAAACGIGHFRILTRYESDDSFNQEIAIEGIRNPFAVKWDPLARLPTRADARYCFITAEMDRKAFEAEYPKARTDGFDSDEGDLSGWHSGETVTVAEYFWRKPETRKLYLLEGGAVVSGLRDGDRVAETREVETDRIMWVKMASHDVLEGPSEWAGSHIPVVAVCGEELHIGREVVRSSVIRYAKEPQQLFNYWRSAQAEVIALQPKAPYIVTPKQVQGLEPIWKTANTANLPYLPYNPDEDAPGRPQRETPPVASQAMLQEIALAVDDLKATTGIYDAGLGNASNETSGVAIRQRQLEGDISTSIYVDNLAQAIEQCGRVILDLMPKIYDTERVIRILGQDGAEKVERINAVIVTPEGPVPINSMLAGRYDVRVSTGPAYSTLRQEAADGMMQFVQAFPQAAPVVGDLIAKNLDWPGAEEMAKRLKSLVPPGVIEPDPQDMTPEMQQQMMAAQQQQAEQQAMQRAAFEVDMRERVAKVAKLEAEVKKLLTDMQASQVGSVKTAREAEGISVDTAQKQFELAAQSGLFDAAVKEAVARVLSGAQPAPAMGLSS